MIGFFRFADQFASQFAAIDGGFEYRYRGSGAAYRVSTQEKLELEAAFKRRLWWAFGAVFAFTLVPLFGFGPIVILTETRPSNWFSAAMPFFSLGLSLVAFLSIARSAFRMPLAVVARRSPVQPATSSANLEHTRFSNITYRKLALGPPVFVLITLWIGVDFDIWQGYGRLVWLMPILGTCYWTYVAWQKWLFDKRPR